MKNGVVIEVVIPNRLGLHLRAAKQLAVLALKFSCDVTVESDSHSVNGKSILALTSLAAGRGSRLRITTKGEDAAAASEQLEKLVSDGFGEE